MAGRLLIKPKSTSPKACTQFVLPLHHQRFATPTNYRAPRRMCYFNFFAKLKHKKGQQEMDRQEMESYRALHRAAGRKGPKIAKGLRISYSRFRRMCRAPNPTRRAKSYKHATGEKNCLDNVAELMRAVHEHNPGGEAEILYFVLRVFLGLQQDTAEGLNPVEIQTRMAVECGHGVGYFLADCKTEQKIEELLHAWQAVTLGLVALGADFELAAITGGIWPQAELGGRLQEIPSPGPPARSLSRR